MILDMHTHLWRGQIERCRTAILRSAERYNCIRTYVSTLGSFQPDEEEIQICNAATADFIHDYPSLIRGWCYLNPRHANVMEVLRRGMEEQGMSGVKLWCATYCDDPLVNPIAEYCIEHDIPVLIHALDKSVQQIPYESTGVHVRALAKRYPQLRIIMAHMGGNEYTGVRAVADCPNVMMDICGVLCRADTITYAIERVGVGRLLYGTDQIGEAPYWMHIGRVNALDIPAEDKERIFWKNAVEYGL